MPETPSDSTTPPVTKVTVVLRSADIDALGHVNHVRYHEFLEEARSAFVRRWVRQEPEAFVLARIELDYLSEIRLAEGSAEVALWISRVGNSSIVVDHDLTAPDGRLVARGSTVMVAWDRERRTKRTFDSAERARLLEAAA